MPETLCPLCGDPLRCEVCGELVAAAATPEPAQRYAELGIVTYGASRFEVIGDGRRVAVFDDKADADRFVLIGADQAALIGAWLRAASPTLAQVLATKAAGALGFDDLTTETRAALDRLVAALDGGE